MPIRIQFFAETDPSRDFAAIAGFLEDLEAVYRYAHIYSNPRYAVYRTAGTQLNSVILDEEDRLSVDRLRVGSLELVLLVAAVPTTLGAVWTFLQILQKTQDWSLDRSIKYATFVKLRRENKEAGEREAARVAALLDQTVDDTRDDSNVAEIKQRVVSLRRSRVRPYKVSTKMVSENLTPAAYLRDRDAKEQARRERPRAVREVDTQVSSTRLQLPSLPAGFDPDALEAIQRFLADHEATRNVPAPVLLVLRQYVARWERPAR